MIETAFKPFQSLGESALIDRASVLLVAKLGRVMGATGTHAKLMQKETVTRAQPQA